MAANYTLQAVSIINSVTRECFINPAKLFGKKSSEKLTYTLEIVSLNGSTDQGVIVPGLTINAKQAYVGTPYEIVDCASDDAYFFIYAKELHDQEIDYKIYHGRSSSSSHGKIVVSKKSVVSGSEFFNRNAIAITDTNCSFQLIRTNPKLTGNIKIVVTEEQRLYLDTFKVNDTLAKFEYRHFSVSSDSNYNTDVRNCFRKLSSDDLYGVPSYCLRAHDPYTEYEDQFETIYSYGAETNDDELYNENFKILAPLWINRLLPDFFVIFRVPGTYNQASYLGVQNDKEIFDNFLRTAEIVKCFDMRRSSPLGKYVQNYWSKIEQYPGSIMLQFKEQENEDPYDNGINSWIGISVDSGLVVKKDEVSYFANEVIQTRSQERFNQFITDGFERNRLLCPHLLNIEFMFNDPDVNNYEMHRYFGLYLKENDFIKYDYVEQAIDKRTHNITIAKYDSNHELVNDNVISSAENSILKKDEYANRLFFGIGPSSVARLKEPSDLNRFLQKEIVNIPYRNILSCKAETIENGSWKNFMSMKFKKQIRYGEHFRICVPEINQEGISTPIVFEIIASNDPRLAGERSAISPFISITNSANGLSDYIYYREIPGLKQTDFDGKEENVVQSYYYRALNGETFEHFSVINAVRYENSYGVRNFVKGVDQEYIASQEEYVDENEETQTYIVTRYPYLFRLTFYTQDIDNPDVAASLPEQLERLKACVLEFYKHFNIDVTVGNSTDDSISILTKYNGAWFQHITADILDNDMVEIAKDKVDFNPDVFKDASTAEELVSNVRIIDYWHDKIIDENLANDETISYFGNDSLNVKAYALSNDSNRHKGQSVLFAPMNFELLGWRKSSIVRMCDFEDHMYEISSDDTNALTRNTLVRTETDDHIRLNDYELESIEVIVHDNLVDASVDLYSDSANAEKYRNALDVIGRALPYMYDRNNEALSNKQVGGKTLFDELRSIGIDCGSEVREANVLAAESLRIKILAFSDRLKNIDNNAYYTTLNTVTIGNAVSAVQSPFNLDKCLVKAPEKIKISNGLIDLYSPSPVSVALMSILPVKDLDTTINDKSSSKITNTMKMEIPKGTKIWIDKDNVDYALRSNSLYTLESGRIEGIRMSPGTSFIIIDKTLYFASKSGAIKSYEIISDYLVTYDYVGNTKTVISTQTDKIKIDYTLMRPQIIEEYYYQDSSKCNQLKYPLVTPTVCNWKGTGIYFDADSVLKVSDLLSPDYKKISKGYMISRLPSVGVKNESKYISKSLESFIQRDSSVVTFREFITNTSMTDSINMFLAENQRPVYTIGYYNKYVNTLDFIVYGIKFSITFNDNQFIKEVQLQNYNKYEIFIINDYTGAKNEMIINTLENTILIVNHNFNFKRFEENTTTFIAEDNKFTYNKSYSWIKTDKTLDLAAAEADKNSVYIPIDENSTIETDIQGSHYYQLNEFVKDDYPYITGKDSLYMFKNQGNVRDMKLYEDFLVLDGSLFVMKSSDSSMSSVPFELNIDQVSGKQSYIINPLHEDSDGNEITSYAYDTELSDAEKYDKMIDDYTSTFREDNLVIYLKKMNGEEILCRRYETSPSYTPIKILVELPKIVKYNIDFYNPNFRDMLSFNLNEEDEIIRETKMNYILSNTSFRDISKIKNYYGYKVFSDLKVDNNLIGSKDGDLKSSGHTNMFIVPEYSLVSSNWDYGFYRLYSSKDDSYKKLDGFIPGVEDKSFFGSRCIKLRDIEIEIEKWNDTEIKIDTHAVNLFSTNESKTSSDNAVITINITQMFYNHFINLAKGKFRDNWNSFTDVENAINNYVKKSMVRYFRINSTNAFKLYSKPSTGTILLKDRPSDFESYNEVKNFTSSYSTVNDEIIMKVSLSDLNKTYYATYSLRSNRQSWTK